MNRGSSRIESLAHVESCAEHAELEKDGSRLPIMMAIHPRGMLESASLSLRSRRQVSASWQAAQLAWHS